ncbi:integrase [Escherichia coli]
MFAGKKSAQIREILISESAWEEMTCLFAPSLTKEFTLPMSKAKTKHVIAFTDRGWQKTFRIRFPF